MSQLIDEALAKALDTDPRDIKCRYLVSYAAGSYYAELTPKDVGAMLTRGARITDESGREVAP